MTRKNSDLNQGIAGARLEAFKPKRWITEDELKNRFLEDSESDERDPQEDHQFFMDWLKQRDIKAQISRNARTHLGGVNSDGSYTHLAMRTRSTPEAAKADDDKRRAALEDTIRLLSPYGGTEAHALTIHQAAIEEDDEQERQADMRAEDAAGINGFEGLRRAHGIEKDLGDFFGTRMVP